MIRPPFDVAALPGACMLIAKVTLVLAAAFAVNAALARRSAALRHAVWLLALSGLLALALLSPVAPRVLLRVLPPRMSVESIRASADAGAAGPAPQAKTELEPGASTPVASASRTVGTPRFRLAPVPIGLALWLAGMLAVLLWCLIGHLGLAWIARNAEPLDDADWRGLANDARERGGLAGRVRFGRSARVGSPLTWGWRRPVILLPRGVESWPRERRRVAALHEFAHVERLDYVAQLVATLACAVFWFHPLVWAAAHRLRDESERACDDLVLLSGQDAPDYAAHLLEVARGERALGLAAIVAVSMARRSHLEGRLLAVLDEGRRRRGLSLGSRLALAAALTALVIPLAGIRLAARAAPPQAEAVELAAAAKPPSSSATKPAPSEGGETVSGQRDFQRSIDAKRGEQLDLDLDTGGKVTIVGSNASSVVVAAHLGGTDWDDTRVAVERTPGGVRITSRFEGSSSGRSTSHRFEITVPKKFDVHINSSGGALAIRDVEGEFRGETGGGEITLEHLKGSAHLSTGGGEIRVDGCDLSGSVTTGGGSVRMSGVRGGLKAWSGSGPVVYAVANPEASAKEMADLGDLSIDEDKVSYGKAKMDSRGVLHLERAGGEVDLDEAPGGAKVTTGGGDIRIGRAGGTVEAQTGGGDIEIGPVAGSVEAGTGAGDVHVTLADAHGKEQNVRVTSGNGRVVLDLPGNLDARFELETAFTDNHGGPTRIKSDWKLTSETTEKWSEDEGTPRRYVRAQGVAGKGTGLIRVKTVNGDIEVRRAGQ